MVSFGFFTVVIDGSRSNKGKEDDFVAGDVSEVTQLRVGVASFAVVARHTGCAAAA